MDESYGAAYARLYHTHWWWRAREAYLEEQLVRILPRRDAGDILDFGCGDGLFFDVLARFGTPYGIEPDGALLDPAGKWRSRISTDRLTPDASQASRFGLVVALDVFEHIDNPAPIAAELAQRTKPGGWWVVTVPAFRALWTRHDDLNRHVTRYTRSELVSLLSGAGMEVVDSSYLFGWLAFAKLLVRAKERLIAGEPQAPGVPPRIANAACYALSRFEQQLSRVVPLPFGSSVLAIARRPG